MGYGIQREVLGFGASAVRVDHPGLVVTDHSLHHPVLGTAGRRSRVDDAVALAIAGAKLIGDTATVCVHRHVSHWA